MRDWDYVRDLAVRHNVDPGPILAEAKAIPDHKRLHSHGPLLYQDYVYAICRILRPEKVIETGTRFGVGASLVLRALDRNGHGALYSCDPRHYSQKQAMDAIRDTLGFNGFDRFTFLAGESKKVLPELAALTGPWDLFIHDSDHGAANMRWELEFAANHLVEHGLIICDDWDWPDEWNQNALPHHVFKRFCQARGRPYRIIGSAAVVEL
jgi:predicted O-methyltransferase YrrM